MNEKTFITIFPGYRDLHFYKDPGQIPYRIGKLGYHSSILLYSDGTELPETVKNINVIKIPDGYFSRRFNTGIIFWLLRNSKKTDVLNLFHLTWQSLLFAFIYKRVNRKGFTYLKLDASRWSGYYGWEKDQAGRVKGGKPTGVSVKRRIKDFITSKYLVHSIDLWSAEDCETCRAYEQEYEFFSGKLINVYNGHVADLIESAPVRAYTDKEEIILTVGRLGTEQKATEMLLESFRLIAGRCSYNLHLAGTVEEEFKEYITTFLGKNPSLRDRIVFHGMKGKKELMDLYNRSRIFCLPSRYEGMAIVFPEAMYFGCVVVTSSFVSPAGLITENELGIVVGELNHTTLAEELMRVIDNEDLAGKMSENARAFSQRVFNWDGIACELEKNIASRMTKRG